MIDDHWQPVPDELKDDEALLKAVLEEHRLVYDRYFRDDLDVNHQLPVMTHAFRRLDRWRVFLLLTPWMLARVFVPDEAQDIEMPLEWQAEARAGLGKGDLNGTKAQRAEACYERAKARKQGNRPSKDNDN